MADDDPPDDLDGDELVDYYSKKWDERPEDHGSIYGPARDRQKHGKKSGTRIGRKRAKQEKKWREERRIREAEADE